MEAGRELDALVAEKVLKFEIEWRCCEDEHHEMGYRPRKVVYSTDGLPLYGEILPGYSTDIAAAWQLMESRQMVGQTIGYLAETPSEHFTDITEDGWARKWMCTSRGEPIYAATAPHAICLAALKAVGVDIDNL